MSTNDLILLFKSTFRNDYKRLLLTALSAPNGTIFRTYYKNEHVSPDLFEKATRSPKSFLGKKLVLIFFNFKDNASLKFYPLRNFIVQKIKSGAALEFFLTPNEYYHYTDTELQDFNARIKSEMPLLPPQDHSWAQFFSPLCLNELRISQDHEAWNSLVEHLDKPEIGKDNDFKESIFFRLSHLNEDGTDATYDAENGYSLKFGKHYIWEGFFYKPRETKESFRIKLEGSEDIKPISEQIITVLPGRSQPFRFEFSCKPVSIDKSIEIRVNVPEKEEGDSPRHEFTSKILKISLIRQIGWGGAAFLFGLIITSFAQTFVLRSGVKLPLSIIGNFISTLGIFFLTRKYL
jgi:hypothetical protein